MHVTGRAWTRGGLKTERGIAGGQGGGDGAMARSFALYLASPLF